MALKVCAAVHNPLDAVAKQPIYRIVGPVLIAEATSYLIHWHRLKNTAKIGHYYLDSCGETQWESTALPEELQINGKSPAT